MRFTLRRLLLGVLFLVLCGVGWFGWQAYQVYIGLQHITGQRIAYVPREPTVTIPSLNGNQRYNILVLGSDNDKKLEERHPLTQSMIVVSVDPVHDQVTLFSIPRDFWVKIPGYGYDKIDTASKRGATLSQGIAIARATVHELFGIPIHFYAWVGLDGFRNVIDTFKGVTVDVSHPIFDDYYPDDQRPGDPYAFTRVFIPAGLRHLSGRQTLEYVRSRHGDSNGDFGRSARQQQVLLALRDKANAFSVITNLPSLVNELQNAVQTDMTISQIYDLAKLSRHIEQANIRRVVLQAPTYSTYGWRIQNGLQASVLLPNWSAIRPLIRQVFAPISAPSPRARAIHRRTPTGRGGRPAASSSPTATPVATQTPAPTATPPALAALPGRLILEKNGNVFEVTRNRSLVQITQCNADAMPSLSPDGKTLAYIRFTTNYADDIWLSHPGKNDCPWNADGAHSWHLQLTQNASTDVHSNLWAAWPQWSADGKTILFASDRQKLGMCPESETRPVDLAIWQMPANGGAPTQLTSPPEPSPACTPTPGVGGAGGDTDPQWRPHSSQFLYVRWSYSPSGNAPVSQLLLQDYTTRAAWPLTDGKTRVLQAAFDRSGNRIVYVQGSSGSSGQSQLMVARVVQRRSGPTVAAQRTLVQGQIAQPAFTPDGRWVSYLQVDGDGFSLFLVPAMGGTPMKIDEAGSDIDSLSRPVWAP
jgi:LCP family protein required for cell wall assembly